MNWSRGRVSDDGRIEVTKDVLDHLAAKAGDSLHITVQDEGTITIRRALYPNVASLRGAAGAINSDLTIDEMIEIAREEHLLEKYGRNDS